MTWYIWGLLNRGRDGGGQRTAGVGGGTTCRPGGGGGGGGGGVAGDLVTSRGRCRACSWRRARYTREWRSCMDV